MIAPPTLTQPPVDPSHDPEALIEEARRRARRRRRRNGLSAGLMLSVGALVVFIGHGWGGGGGQAAPGAGSPRIAVAASSGLMSNGPLTVIRQASGHGGIYTVGRTGLGRLVAKCHGCLEVEHIAWSSDGSRLAVGVTSYGIPSSLDGLHVIDVATGRDRQLTGGGEMAGAYVDPAWSPDGQWIAYENDRIGTLGLVKADGSQRAVLDTHLAEYLRSPTWSPDGSRIAFAATGSRGPCGYTGTVATSECEIYVSRLDGSDVHLLARNATSPAWSPLGTVIAYEARCGIRLVTPVGSNVTPKAETRCAHIGVPGQPVFSPDGRKIAINSPAKGGVHGVYVMNADGSDLHRLTRETGRADYGVARVAWQPLRRYSR